MPPDAWSPVIAGHKAARSSAGDWDSLARNRANRSGQSVFGALVSLLNIVASAFGLALVRNQRAPADEVVLDGHAGRGLEERFKGGVALRHQLTKQSPAAGRDPAPTRPTSNCLPRPCEKARASAVAPLQYHPQASMHRRRRAGPQKSLAMRQACANVRRTSGSSKVVSSSG